MTPVFTHHPIPLRAGDWPDLLGPSAADLSSKDEILRREWILNDDFSLSPRWLESAPFFPKIFWRSRSGGSPLLAFGQVASGSVSELSDLLANSDSGIRLFGGSRFAQTSKAHQWPFPSDFYFIPKAEVTRVGSATKLAIHFTRDDLETSAIAAWIAGLDGMGKLRKPGVLTRGDQPPFSKWSEAVHLALQKISSGLLEKVVLARQSTFELAEKITPYAFLGLLMGETPSCFHFCFEPTKESGAFLGASPEQLYRRVARNLQSEAVAGTRPRSLDPAEDTRLESQLRDFSKEQLEHRLVVDDLSRAFRELCVNSSYDETPDVLKLARVQHLRTQLRGELASDLSDGEILEGLHPTPATCGSPTMAARSFIEENEFFDRGWYAGPLGWISREDAEFCVAIRSMHLLERRLNVFAGAGIVEGSDAEREWSELEDKISGVLHILAP